jgi:hypothetical protein
LEKQLRLERKRQEQLTGTMTLAAKMGRSIPKMLEENEGPKGKELGHGEHIAMKPLPLKSAEDNHEDVCMLSGRYSVEDDLSSGIGAP